MKPFSLSLPLSAALLVWGAACKTEPKIGAVPLPVEQPSTPAPGTGAAPAPAAAGGKVTTASGLQYQVLASGLAGGRAPTRLDSVTVHYRGTLTDGTVFDSSYDRGQPATFGVGQVIPGWTEALQLMKPGDKWMLYIPSNLAYGPRAVGAKIPANSDLIFQVELLGIVGS